MMDKTVWFDISGSLSGYGFNLELDCVLARIIGNPAEMVVPPGEQYTINGATMRHSTLRYIAQQHTPNESRDPSPLVEATIGENTRPFVVFNVCTNEAMHCDCGDVSDAIERYIDNHKIKQRETVRVAWLDGVDRFKIKPKYTIELVPDGTM